MQAPPAEARSNHRGTRGGRRAGAGAPRGNKNAFRAGTRSRAFQPLFRALGPFPAQLLAIAIDIAFDQALELAPVGSSRHGAALRRKARDYALARIAACLVGTGIDDHHGPYERYVRLRAALTPIWEGHNATPPFLIDLLSEQQATGTTVEKVD